MQYLLTELDYRSLVSGSEDAEDKRNVCVVVPLLQYEDLKTQAEWAVPGVVDFANWWHSLKSRQWETLQALRADAELGASLREKSPQGITASEVFNVGLGVYRQEHPNA